MYRCRGCATVFSVSVSQKHTWDLQCCFIFILDILYLGHGQVGSLTTITYLHLFTSSKDQTYRFVSD